MRQFFRKLRWLRHRPAKEADLQEELRFHLDEETEERQSEGLPVGEAQHAARRHLGNLALVQEDTRAAWTWQFLEDFAKDVRYALRAMAANRTFSALAVLSLALGIGANTAIYSFLDSILLRSLPVSDPQSLALLNWHADQSAASAMESHGSTVKQPDGGRIGGIFPYDTFALFQQQTSVFSSVFAYCPTRDLNLAIHGQADIASGEYVSGDYFRDLRVAPAAGRLISPNDDRVGAPAIAVAGFAFARKHFGGAASALSQTIRLNGVPFLVVGVAPPEFFGVNPAASPDYYLPLHASFLIPNAYPRPGWYRNKNSYWLEMMARLRPGVSLKQAQAALNAPFHQFMESSAASDKERAHLPALVIVEGARGLDALRRRYSEPLYILLTLVGLILAIACANIANLLLARASARRREIAMRLSLGAGRPRLIRQLLTESVVLASMGGALGVLFAIWGVRVLTFLLANGRENFTLRAELNWHVLGAAAALSLLTGVLFGLAPALQSTRVAIGAALKEARAGGTRSRFRVSLSHVLVVSQISLSLLMLVAAGLFVRTLSNLQSVPLGFNPGNLLLFELNARHAGHKGAEMASFYRDLQQRFAAIPGVRDVSLSSGALIGDGTWSTDIFVSGVRTKDGSFLSVGPGFFTTMQIPILLGRAIEARDHSRPVVVVNEQFVKANFGGQNPIGRSITMRDDHPQELEIVGVAANTRYDSLKADIPEMAYVPYALGIEGTSADQMTYAVRTSGNPLAFANAIREIVHRADPLLPVANVKTQAARIDQTINQEIIFAKLCTGFSILALLIACVGLYGTMSYAVARRTGEIGIRMALGAPSGSLVWMVLRQVCVLAAVGLAISVPTALWTTKFVESFLFAMQPNDPLSITLAATTLLAAALLAGYFPARRASRIDPMIAIRHE